MVIIPTLFPTLFEPFGALPPTVGRLHVEGGCIRFHVEGGSFSRRPERNATYHNVTPTDAFFTWFLINAYFFLKSFLSYLKELISYYLLW